MSAPISNTRPPPDALLTTLADYVLDPTPPSDEALDTARWCLLDSLACAIMALQFPACTKLLGPVVPGTTVTNGARVPGTAYELDPIQAAFNIGTMVRWLDFNDTWLAAEWGHPSDNLGALLATADWIARHQAAAVPLAAFNSPLSARNAHPSIPTVRDLLVAMIKAHEIQGVLALDNAFNRVGLDHVLLVRIASTAVVTRLLGGTRGQIINALSRNERILFSDKIKYLDKKIQPGLVKLTWSSKGIMDFYVKDCRRYARTRSCTHARTRTPAGTARRRTCW